MLAKSPFLFDEALALRMMAESAERQGPLDCEITEGSVANWYLVQTFPNEEPKAMRWLAKRRFGAFRPMQQLTDKRNGLKLQGYEPIFPGWIFVFVWSVERMRKRILACPGVFTIFKDPVTMRPAPIKDEFVQHLRSIGWDYEDTNRHKLRVVGPSKKPKRARLDKRHRRTLEKLKKTLKKQGNFESSTWSQLNELAPHQRIALLQRAVSNSAAFVG